MNGFKKGINLGGWLSQCDYSEDRLQNFITEKDFAVIAGWGADHVRIPFDYNLFEDENGNRIDRGFERLHFARETAKKYGLNLMLDLHKTAGFSFDTYAEHESGFFDSPEYQERFYRLWADIAKVFGDDPAHIAFELLNEVTDQEFITSWNKIVPQCIRRIRQFAPQTKILVGSYHNNSALTVQYLEAPYDENTVYNMHCYEPLKFTHQGAYWTDAINPEERMSFDSCNITEDYFEELFSSAIQKAEEYGAELYCGEYGIIDFVSPEDAVKWYRTIHNVFERHGIGRCAWSYKEMDFGLSGARLDGVREELLKLI